jgi:hypothetical protein
MNVGFFQKMLRCLLCPIVPGFIDLQPSFSMVLFRQWFLKLFFSFNVVISQVYMEMIGQTTTKNLDMSKSETPLESQRFNNFFLKVQCVEI